MEFVEGDTLADQLRAGSVSIEQALARQIAEALEAAHEKGIIHRDLKRANIKITPEGRVKVLDFGLAKMFDPLARPSASLSPGGGEGWGDAGYANSPTMMSATMGGVILGTAAYMSPEQARGKSVDKRADVWAFGCVLYEMLTGRAAFDGETISDIIGAIVKTDPDWTVLPPQTPAAIRRLLKRCLAKEARERVHDMADARLEIAEAQVEPAAAHPTVAQPTARARVAWLVAAGATLVALLALAAALYFRAAAVVAPEMRLEISTPPTLDPIAFALSPDGRRLVFIASGEGQSRLWLRALDRPTARPLAGTEDPTFPFWAPDSQSIGFFSGGKLKRIDVSDGPPQVVADAAVGRGGAWSRNGVILFAPNTFEGLARVPATGGEVVAVTRLAPGQTSHRFPVFLPDHRQFLFYVQGTAEQPGLYLGALDGSKPARLASNDTAAIFLPPDHVLLVRQGALVARHLDLTRRALTGDPVTVADSVAADSNFNSSAIAALAEGVIAYRGGGASRRQLIWVDRTGRVLGVVGSPDDNASQYPELAFDGRRVAFQRTVQGNTDVWLLEVARGVPTRFTFDANIDAQPLWSPDGQTIVFRSGRRGVFDLYRKPASGAGSETPLLLSPQIKHAQDWSPDGHALLYRVDDAKTGSDLWILPLDGDRTPKPLLQTAFSEQEGQFSPDGGWLAYQSNESGPFEIYVQPFPGPGGKWQVSTAGGMQPRWRPDGKELYYVAPDGKLTAAPIHTTGTTFETGTPVALFPTRLALGRTALRQQYDVAPDGRFLLCALVEDVATPPITLILNWKPR